MFLSLCSSISIGGRGQRVKSAQDTIKILLKYDLSSSLTHFLAIIGSPGPPKEIYLPEVTPLLVHNVLAFSVSCRQGRNFISLWEDPSPPPQFWAEPYVPNVGKKRVQI